MPSRNSSDRGRAFRWISSCFKYRSNHRRLHQKAADDNKTAQVLQRYLSADDCCPICLGELIGGGGDRGSTVKVLPRCAHVFHEECIGEWLPSRSQNCPVCREPAVTEEDRRHELIKKVANGSVLEYAYHFSNMYLGYFILVG